MKIRRIPASSVAIFILGLGLLLVIVYSNDIDAYTQTQVEQKEVGPGVEQVVIFQKRENEVGLQNEINAWLDKNHNNLEIICILQSQSGRSVRQTTISIFYKKTG